jgi:hypothetical protein
VSFEPCGFLAASRRFPGAAGFQAAGALQRPPEPFHQVDDLRLLRFDGRRQFRFLAHLRLTIFTVLAYSSVSIRSHVRKI